MSKFLLNSMTASLIEYLKREPELLAQYRGGYEIYFKDNPFTNRSFTREVCDSFRYHAPKLEAPYWQFLCNGMDAVKWDTVADFIAYGKIKDLETGQLEDVPEYDAGKYEDE